MSEFEDFINVLVANEESTNRQKSRDFHERISRKDKAIRSLREEIIESFDKVSIGGNFGLSMAGKEVMLFFTGKVFESRESPNGFAAAVTLKAARRHSIAATGSEHDVQCDFKEDGECVPEELFETVTAAVRELFETP